jgi:molybdate transport system substrate-binding protein
MKRVAAIVAAAALASASAALAVSMRAQAGITVFAAASLTDVLPKIDAQEQYSFAGSNALAAQIEQGAPADVFASANTTIPQQLYAKGLVEKPVVFTRNALIMIVPKSNPANIHTVYDLRKPGLKLVVAAAGVPVGDYTRTVLHNLGLDDALANVVSEETDVREVLAKVALGEADAGFVYTTDARAVRGKVATIGIRQTAQPIVQYAVAVVTASTHQAAAQQFVRTLTGKAAQRKLLAAGFLSRK